MSVYVSQSVGSRNKYHTEMCRNAKDIEQIREVSLITAREMGLEECRICADSVNKNTGQNWSYQNALRNHE